MCISVSLKCRWLMNSLIPNYIHRKLLQSVEATLVNHNRTVKKYMTKSFVDMYIQLKKPQNSIICLVP